MLYLGIELGSTRIKAVLIDETFSAIASGSHEWENSFENNNWTYSLDDVKKGVQGAYAVLASDYKSKTGVTLTRIDGIGISAMMHGYLAFDKDFNLLTPFRTWRNTTTAQAAEILTEAFGFNIPQRWSAAHLYQAILNDEAHVKNISFMTTLSGYVHFLLTGEKVLGIGDASGMFPVNGFSYNQKMLDKFNELAQMNRCTNINLAEILPRILSAGENAGKLTEEGAAFLDPTGTLKAGAPLCPPEGDAGTGMTATNSIAPCTGNISAGTSIFAMFVLEKPLENVYKEIDVVTTPDGKPVAMVHCNSCTSDLNEWVKLLGEAAELLGASFDKSALYEKLYLKALEGKPDGGGLLSYNFYSGEPAAGLEKGCPLFFRKPDADMNLADFMRVQIYSAISALKIGTLLLTRNENVKINNMFGHGGLFKTKGVGQKIMADALNIPITVMESAAEGGAWGIALLAAYAGSFAGTELKEKMSLEEFLNKKVFAANSGSRVEPDQDDAAGFAKFFERYKKGLIVEQAAANIIEENNGGSV